MIGRNAPRSRLISYNPVDGERVGEVAVDGLVAIDERVSVARHRAAAWGRTTPAERAATLRPAAARLQESAEDLARLITLEMGKPLHEARREVHKCSNGFERSLQQIVEALGEEVHEDAAGRSVVRHVPFGVCAAITPWNYPMLLPYRLVLPALVAGNTVLLKPSEVTPLVAAAYADVLNACLPEGVLQVVQGGPRHGRHLVAADVDLIAFVGSHRVGRSVLATAAAGFKRVILELGGSDPLVVLSDAHLDRAVDFAAYNSFRNGGQTCTNTRRIYVDDSIASVFEEKLVVRTGRLKVGNGLDDAVDVGPLVSQEHKRRVLRRIEEAVASGARLLCGGRGRGNFLEPTILTHVTPAMRLARDETFGPVVCLYRFHEDQEAIRLANATRLGLGAVVFGEDGRRAQAVADALHAGMIGINHSCVGAAGTPWVGAKESGYGYHGSVDGHRQFAQKKVLTFDRDGR